MTFKTIEYMLAILEEGGFSRAAQRLYISQPALSQAIRKAEEEIGTPLFVRDTRSIHLTAAGELLVREGRELIKQRDDLVHHLAGMSSSQRETIRFGISPFYSKYYLPVVLPYFSDNFPASHLKVTEEISVTLEQMVIDGELDLCFVPLEPQNPRLNYEIIHVEEILLAVPPQHLLHAHATVSTGATPYIDLSLFAQEPFIALKPVQKFNSMNERLCSAAGFTPHVVYETLNWDTVNILAANGIGVGFVPDILRAASMYNRRPKYYRLMGMDTSRAYAVAYKKGMELSSLERQLVELFRTHIKRLVE